MSLEQIYFSLLWGISENLLLYENTPFHWFSSNSARIRLVPDYTLWRLVARVFTWQMLYNIFLHMYIHIYHIDNASTLLYLLYFLNDFVAGQFVNMVCYKPLNNKHSNLLHSNINLLIQWWRTQAKIYLNLNFSLHIVNLIVNKVVDNKKRHVIKNGKNKETEKYKCVKERYIVCWYALNWRTPGPFRLFWAIWIGKLKWMRDQSIRKNRAFGSMFLKRGKALNINFSSGKRTSDRAEGN